jgi:hypothetical protein
LTAEPSISRYFGHGNRAQGHRGDQNAIAIVSARFTVRCFSDSTSPRLASFRRRS